MTDKSKKTRITKSMLDKTRQDLKALASAPPDDFSTKESIRHLLPTIDQALSNGRTMTQIHEALTKRGFQIKLTTLVKYLREARITAKEIAPDFVPDVQEDGTSNNEATPSAPDQDDGGPKLSIKLMTLDEAEGDLPDANGATEMPRSPDDDMLDELLDQRDQGAPHLPKQDEGQGSRTE